MASVSEEAYWREHHHHRPYASADRDVEYYLPGYRYGFESASEHAGRDWDDAEPDLRAGWERYEHRGRATWEHVRHAVRDAWDRVRSRVQRT